MNFEIILADIDEDLCEALSRRFRHPKVSVCCDDLFEVDADAYASPANSHGIMDGGFDRLLRLRFPGIETRVQREIDARGGLLRVGEAVTVETDDSDVPFVICAPTMLYPGDVSMSRNAYAAMLAILRAVRQHNDEREDEISSVAIPGLGTGIGRMPPITAAYQMFEGFQAFLDER